MAPFFLARPSRRALSLPLLFCFLPFVFFNEKKCNHQNHTASPKSKQTATRTPQPSCFSLDRVKGGEIVGKSVLCPSRNGVSLGAEKGFWATSTISRTPLLTSVFFFPFQKKGASRPDFSLNSFPVSRFRVSAREKGVTGPRGHGEPAIAAWVSEGKATS